MYPMKDFTKTDWYAYSGARCFKDGSEPQICEYGPLTIIHDFVGVQAFVEEHEAEAFILESMDVEYCADVINTIAETTKGMTPNQMLRYLQTL